MQSVKYLGKPEGTPVTPQIAREIGEREGIKAIITGTIANLGKQYVITLTAQNTATGDEIVSEQAQAPDKEHVLDALGKAAAALRGKLGEDLESIKKLDTPFGQATTSSLEAFRAYALGDKAHVGAHDVPEAEGHYLRAVELDPNFAMAHARLGVVYANSGQVAKANKYFARAFELSKNVSEREKLYITGHYNENVTGNLPKVIETLQEAIQAYPNADRQLHQHQRCLPGTWSVRARTGVCQESGRYRPAGLDCGRKFAGRSGQPEASRRSQKRNGAGAEARPQHQHI